MEEIEDNAAEVLRKSQEGESIEDDFFHSLSCFPMRLQNGHWTTG
jgi:hypothetical protein